MSSLSRRRFLSLLAAAPVGIPVVAAAPFVVDDQMRVTTDTLSFQDIARLQGHLKMHDDMLALKWRASKVIGNLIEELEVISERCPELMPLNVRAESAKNLAVALRTLHEPATRNGA